MARTFQVWSRPLDVHRWSDHQSTTDAVDQAYGEIAALRRAQGGRVRDSTELRKHIRVLLLDLFVAAQERVPGARRTSPRWVGVARAKGAYRLNASRYNRLFLSYRHLIGALDDLITLGYVKQVKGFHDRRTRIGRQTRIRARSKLMRLMAQHQVTREVVQRQPQETIILRDADGNDIEYVDTEETIRWRGNLDLINRHLATLRIRLFMPDDEFRKLNQRMADDLKRGAIDYSRNQLKRVFNNGSFREGGRFYGGWWENIPKEYRPFLEINRKGTVEIDYSGMHLRMLYALIGEIVPDEPYDLPGIPRDQQKHAAMIMINANSEVQAIRALQKRLKGVQIRNLLGQIAKRHDKVSRYFYTGVGVRLQFRDSCIAEKVMLKMLEREREVLPVHDSFVMRASLEDELVQAMEAAFSEEFPGIQAIPRFKETDLEIRRKEEEEKKGAKGKQERIEEEEFEFMDDDIEWMENFKEYLAP